MAYKILFYRYGSIVENNLIECFKNNGIEVIEENTQITKKDTSPADTVKSVSEALSKDTFIFVFSINFFPAVSEICQIYNKPYVCWTVDSPIMELFSPALSNKCNKIFMFDKAQYNYFLARNPQGIFYLPLATNVNQLQSVINQASSSDLEYFKSDISFIGSLYSEKDPYSKIQGLSEYTKGYVDGIIEAQIGIYGYNFIEDMLNETVMNDFMKHVPDLTQTPYTDSLSASYCMANNFIGMHLAVKERALLLNTLSQHFNVDLYTLSDSSALPKVNVRGAAKTLTEMPIIFNQSKINLNITIKPIQTGLSQRVFDVMGSSGFLITNYQEELPEMYEPGVEVETFSSKEELVDKVGFYLNHDKERCAIAQNGFKRTLRDHSYEVRVRQMLKIILDNY